MERFEEFVERAVARAVFGSLDPGRREFLARVGVATASAALASVFPLSAAQALAQDKPGPPEKKDLKFGMQLRQHAIRAVWNKASGCESCLYIILIQCYLPSLPIQ